jgi:hypothetical protein
MQFLLVSVLLFRVRHEAAYELRPSAVLPTPATGGNVAVKPLVGVHPLVTPAAAQLKALVAVGLFGGQVSGERGENIAQARLVLERQLLPCIEY